MGAPLRTAAAEIATETPLRFGDLVEALAGKVRGHRAVVVADEQRRADRDGSDPRDVVGLVLEGSSTIEYLLVRSSYDGAPFWRRVSRASARR